MKPNSGASSVELNLWNLAGVSLFDRSIVDRLMKHDVSLIGSSVWSSLLSSSSGLFSKVSPFHLIAVGNPDPPVRRDDRLALINFIVTQGYGLDEADAYDWTPLAYAAWYGYSALVDIFLECGANPNASHAAALSSALAQVGTVVVRTVWPPCPDRSVLLEPASYHDISVSPVSAPDDHLEQSLESLWSPLWSPILLRSVAHARKRSDGSRDEHLVDWPGHSPSPIPLRPSAPISLMDLSKYWLASDPSWSGPHATCARLLLAAGAAPGTQAPSQSGAPISSKRTWLAWALGAERFSWANLLWRHGARLTNQDRQAMVLDGNPLPLAWCSLHGDSLASLLGVKHDVWGLISAVDTWVERSHMAAVCGQLRAAPNPDQDWIGWLMWLDQAAVLDQETGAASGSGRIL